MFNLFSRSPIIPQVRRYMFRFALAATVSLAPFWGRSQSMPAATVQQNFRTPPADARIMMRWWWFGPAVTKPEITRELEQMKAAGIGGVEIADLYALQLDDPSRGFHNQRFLSDEHIGMLRFAGEEARRLGLRVDVTLGSGWPFGGPHIPVTQNAGMLRSEVVPIVPGEDFVRLPSISAGEKLIAAFSLPDMGSSMSMTGAKAIPIEAATETQFRLPTGAAGARSVLFFLTSRTGMVVKRPSVGAEGFVLDHYDPAAVANHLHAVGDRLLQAFPDQPPYSMFSDSLEVAGSNWTGDYLAEFQKRRGYDLLPHLPALIGDVGPETDAVRHDWGKTLTELVDERYLAAVQQWAHSHHTQFRSQTYGNPPVTLGSYRYADLIEGEGGASPRMWRDFSSTRWAASAGHIYDKPVVSSETWTWLHSPSFRAVPIDMKAEADLHFLQGINQLIGHGWPYSPENVPEPGQRMYAAAAFNSHNPWSFAMPDVTAYLQRVSFALRQGIPSANVALYMPNDDAWASFYAVHQIPTTANPVLGATAPGVTASPARNGPADHSAAHAAPAPSWGNVSVDGSIRAMLDQDLIGSILDAGFSLDFIDPTMVDKVGSRYPVLVLPSVKRMDVAVYRAIEQYAKAGGLVIAMGQTPSMAPGFLKGSQDDAEIQTISQRLFLASGHPGHKAENDAELSTTLTEFAKAEVKYDIPQSNIGFLHRKLPGGDLYFVANTSNMPQPLHATFAHSATKAEWWDAFTGESAAVRNPGHIEEMLEPYGSRLLYFSDATAPHISPATPARKGPRVQMDLSSDWKLTVGQNQPQQLHKLSSWADDPKFRYYSGSAFYEKQVNLNKTAISGGSLFLDFGPVKPEEVAANGKVIRTQAFLQAPVRDVAEVTVNDHKVGVVWRPPYQIDIAKYLHVGTNLIRVKVANTAINELAGETQPSLRLLRSLYGNTFQPQDMEDLVPLPSGLLGPVTLHSEWELPYAK